MAQRTKLTAKQHKWLEEYQKTGNATEAAAIVYNCATRAVAQAIGAENLCKPILISAIEKRRADTAEKTDVTVIQQVHALLRISDKAEAAGKFTAAVAARSAVIKTLGGFMADRPTNESLAAKALDLATLRELSAISETYLHRRYNGIEPKVIEANCTENYNTMYKTDDNGDNLDKDTSIPGE